MKKALDFARNSAMLLLMEFAISSHYFYNGDWRGAGHMEIADSTMKLSEGAVDTQPVIVENFAEAELPTQWGRFKVIVFHNNLDDKEHLALIKGEPFGKENVLARIHSECLTSEVFGSLKCDCRDQLDTALERIQAEKMGILVYLRQEGRGIGLGNKIRAYALQNEGFDTVEANEMLGFRDDQRDFAIAAHILKYLDIFSVRIMTNNPKKVESLLKNGIKVAERLPHEMSVTSHNAEYLQIKRDKSGHLLQLNLPRSLLIS
jgi:GTP cyclohydrolase II